MKGIFYPRHYSLDLQSATPGIRRLISAFSCVLFLLAACHSRSALSPKAVYEDAELKFTHGDLQAASLEADSGLRSQKDAQSSSAWRFRLLKAEILIWQGFAQDAINLLSQEPSSTADQREPAAYRLVILGEAYSNLQQLDEAKREFAKAEQLNHPESSEVTCRLLLGQGRLAAIRRDIKESDRMFRLAAHNAHEQKHPLIEANALGNLGVMNMQQGHFAEAADWFNASIILAQSLKAKATETRALGNLGWAYLEMGDLDRAEESFSKAQTASQQLGLLGDEDTWLVEMGDIRFLQRDHAGAKTMYENALQIARKLDDRPVIIYNLTNLSRIAIEYSQFPLAESYNREALALEDVSNDHESSVYNILNEAKIASGTHQYDSARRLFKEVAEGRSKASWRVEAQGDLARLEEQGGHPAAAEQYHRSSIALLEKERRSLGREEFKLTYPTNAKDAYNGYVDFLVRQGESDRAFTVVEMHRARTLTDGLGLERRLTTQSTLAEAQRAAARLGRVFLSYWLGPERSYLWLIRPTGSQMFLLPAEDKIRPLVEHYRSHLTGTLQSQHVADTDGQELYKVLVGPAEHRIKPEAHVTIIPDGALYGLNFETLIVSSPKPHYWIEDVAVTNASSTVLLSAAMHSTMRRSMEPTKRLLMIGDPKAPVFYRTLAHAGDEMSLIQRHFSSDQETVISGADATPTAYFKAKPENYSLIHFVAHGTASRISPLDSAVVLSEDGSSYNLYARDIAHAKLHAKLVTISTCDSAGSRIYSSEGLVGLSWAFLRAGAQQVIAALWEVDDTSTPQLMNDFYSGIAAGEEPTTALRAAKLQLLRSQSVYARPFYWGPLVLYEGAAFGHS